MVGTRGAANVAAAEAVAAEEVAAAPVHNRRSQITDRKKKVFYTKVEIASRNSFLQKQFSRGA